MSLWNKESRNLPPPPPFAMSYIIWCIIVGETIPFPVNIDETQSVGELKHAIKEEIAPRLNAFPVHQLTLYKIDAKYDETNYENGVESVEPNQDQKLGFQLRKLSAVFGLAGPSDDKIHILVEPPAGESIKVTVCGAVACRC